VYGDQLNGGFIAFQNHEVDRVDYIHLKPSDYVIINENEELRVNFRPHAGDFRTDYLLFDTFTPPFDDLRVRLAFAKAVDRVAIADNVITSAARRPYPAIRSGSASGWDEAGDFRDVRRMTAMQPALLAETGYPEGEASGAE
jgi:ABC-type transport system substrate-binding protein